MLKKNGSPVKAFSQSRSRDKLGSIGTRVWGRALSVFVFAFLSLQPISTLKAGDYLPPMGTLQWVTTSH